MSSNGMSKSVAGGNGTVKFPVRGMFRGMKNKRREKWRMEREAIAREREIRQARLEEREEAYLEEYAEYTALTNSYSRK